MKNFFPALIVFSFLLYACNSSSVKNEETKDTVQQLLNSIRDSVNIEPGDPARYFSIAEALQQAGQYSEALATLDSMRFYVTDSIDLPVYARYLYKKSELEEQAGDTANAIKTLEKLVVPGEITQASMRLANLYAETNNNKVLALCNAMIENDQDGRIPEPDYFRGVYYYNKGDFERAIKEFDNSIRKDYNFMDAHLEKGVSLYQLKKYQESIAALDLALKVSNSFADAYYWKGKCQEALGQKEEAKQNYLRAYGLDKTFAKAKAAADNLK